MRLRCGFTLVEILVVITIIALLAAILMPAIGGLLRSRDRAMTMGIVRGLQISLEAYRVDQGFLPAAPADGMLIRDQDDDSNLIVQLSDRYGMTVDSQFYIDGVLCDVWQNPIQYRKGDYGNRIAKKDKTADDNPQDTNHPLGDDIIARESDWNRDNRGGYAYVWSYGPDGEGSDSKDWVYIKDE